ncbi:MAG TPA: hypothetical protein VFI70_03875 [Nitrososphaeraceae archaeon]|nr:hypothetical protein [Nitrososphaeraceae archaeon]
MTIEWDAVIVENVFLAVIIVGTIYLETWIQRKTQQRRDKEMLKHIIALITSDLQGKLRFIEESIKYNDYKPFFTNIWDAVILSGRHTLFPFEKIQDLEHTYSWMKYYNTELQSNKLDENVLNDILEDVRKSINQSINLQLN